MAQKSYIRENINSYDNSILYNDFIVTKIIETFKKSSNVGALLYFSDHSENVDFNTGHNPDNFSYQMCDIPMYLYISKEYKKRYPKKLENIKANSSKLFNNAFIYDSLIGLMDINTAKFEKSHDFTSDSYNLPKDQAFTLHGKLLYTSIKNKNYIINKNIEKKGVF